MLLRSRTALVALAVLAAVPGCDPRRAAPDGGLTADASALDASSLDAGASRIDAGARDAGAGADAGRGDAGVFDAGLGADGGAGDGGARDAGASGDAGPPDAGASDAGAPSPDAGPPSGGCISGATGTHVARFRWEGSGSGSRAYVVYEANTLPDPSRWRAGAYSRGPIGSYTPTFRDPFLGEGGLELSGTAFMDIELSTAGLGVVRSATVAIYGRSYHTTTSGSFTWMTFDGSGASPYGGVANSAPYEWYGTDATAGLPAGNAGVLLRMEAGGPSGALIVRRVEICIDAG